MVSSLNAYYVMFNFIQTNKKVSEVGQFYLIIQTVTTFLYVDLYKITWPISDHYRRLETFLHLFYCCLVNLNKLPYSLG